LLQAFKLAGHWRITEWPEFEGEAPYFLGMAQRVSAQSVLEFGKVVELVVYVVLDGQGPDPKPVHIQMPRRVANDAATALIQAATRHLQI
jgi:hypothetical protein